MPASKKKGITPENGVSTSESSSPGLPEQQEFHQHLRALAQSAVRTVLELVMRGQAELGERLERAAGSAAHRHLRALLELLSLIYREALDAAAQRQAFRTLLQRFEQDERVRRTVQVESRFGRTSQAIVLGMIPAFVALSALVGSSLGSEVSTLDFYFGTLPGRAIVVAVLVVEGLVVLLSRRMVRQIRWD